MTSRRLATDPTIDRGARCLGVHAATALCEGRGAQRRIPRLVSQLPRPERLRRSADGACVASDGSCRPGPTCVPMRSVGSGNLIGRDLGDFAAGHACSERSRRRSVLRGRLTAARPSRDTVPLPPAISVSAPLTGLSEARHGLRATTGRATITVGPSFATRSSPPSRSLRSRSRKGIPRYRLVETEHIEELLAVTNLAE